MCYTSSSKQWEEFATEFPLFPSVVCDVEGSSGVGISEIVYRRLPAYPAIARNQDLKSSLTTD